MKIYAIDIETYAPDLEEHEFILEFVKKHKDSGKKVTKTTYNSAEKAFNKLNKEIALDPKRNAIRLLQLATVDGSIIILDFFKKEDRIRAEKFILDVYPKSGIIAHNFKFDGAVIFEKYGVMPLQVFDTMLAARLIYNFTELPMKKAPVPPPGVNPFAYYNSIGYKPDSDKRYSASLQNVLHNFIGVDLPKDQGGSDWSGVLSQEQLLYAENDVKYLFDLANYLVHQLNTDSSKSASKPFMLGLTDFVSVLEMEFVKDLIKIERLGVRVNTEALLEKVPQLEKTLSELTDKLGDMNPNSYIQVRKHLADHGIITEVSDQKFLESVDDTPLVKEILEFKRTRKLIKDISKYTDPSGRVYTNFTQIKHTGRMSSSNENVQQLNKKIKDIFYSKGTIEIDYNAVELRIAAEIMGIKALKDVFNSGKDAHIYTVVKVTKISESEVDKDKRTLGKGMNFGLLFGMGDESFNKYLSDNFNINMTIDQSTVLRNAFFEVFPEIAQFHTQTGNDLLLHPNGTVYRDLAGRRTLSDSYTVLNNCGTQGTGATLLKLAVILYMKKYENVMSLVHDSIILDQPSQEQIDFCCECMEKAGEYIGLNTPVEVDKY